MTPAETRDSLFTHDDPAIPSSLAGLRPLPRPATAIQVAEDRARAAGLPIVTCHTCDAPATREECRIARPGHPTTVRTLVRCLRVRAHVHIESERAADGAEEVPMPKSLEPRPCECGCGAAVEQPHFGPARKWATLACKARGARSRAAATPPKGELRTCACGCGQEFVPRKPRQKCASRTCNNRLATAELQRRATEKKTPQSLAPGTIERVNVLARVLTDTAEGLGLLEAPTVNLEQDLPRVAREVREERDRLRESPDVAAVCAAVCALAEDLGMPAGPVTLEALRARVLTVVEAPKVLAEEWEREVREWQAIGALVNVLEGTAAEVLEVVRGHLQERDDLRNRWQVVHEDRERLQEELARATNPGLLDLARHLLALPQDQRAALLVLVQAEESRRTVA